MTRHRRVLRSVFLIAVLGCAGSAPLAAQPASLEPGTRVRVQVAGAAAPVRGHVEMMEGDTLTMIVQPASDRLKIAFADVETLERFHGERTRTATGAVVGVLGGAVAGGVTGGLIHRPRRRPPCDTWECAIGRELDGLFGEIDRSMGIMAGALVGGLAGVVVGAAIGSKQRREEWQRVGVDAGLGVAPARGGGLAVSASIPLARRRR